MQSIETRYAGCRFRSRLEARWAVFFDCLGVTWHYEPEGFALRTAHGSGIYYLPDFWLPGLNTWFEVKGTRPDALTEQKLDAFVEELVRPVRLITAIGGIPDPRHLEPHGHPVPYYEPDAFDIWLGCGQDYHYAWCLCPWCGKAGIEFDARGARVCGWKSHEITEDEAWAKVEGRHWRIDDKCYTGDDPLIVKAYTEARSARFDRGSGT
jgi:hypothetical protein